VAAAAAADEKYLYPKMAPHQRALLIPDGSASAHLKPGANGSRSGWCAQNKTPWRAGSTLFKFPCVVCPEPVLGTLVI
jgi:hypothetical protein